MNSLQGYTIRPARADDIDSVVGLSHLWAEEGCTAGYTPLAKADQPLQAWLDGGYFLVGTHQKAVVAFSAGLVKLGKNAVFKPEGERFLHIHQVFVHADHRGRGVGDRLVAALLEKATAAGVHRSMVGSNNIDWLRTFQFYQRQGFKMFSIDMYK